MYLLAFYLNELLYCHCYSVLIIEHPGLQRLLSKLDGWATFFVVTFDLAPFCLHHNKHTSLHCCWFCKLWHGSCKKQGCRCLSKNKAMTQFHYSHFSNFPPEGTILPTYKCFPLLCYVGLRQGKAIICLCKLCFAFRILGAKVII